MLDASTMSWLRMSSMKSWCKTDAVNWNLTESSSVAFDFAFCRVKSA